MKHKTITIAVVALVIALLIGWRSYTGYIYKLEWTSSAYVLRDLYLHISEYGGVHSQLPDDIEDWRSRKAVEIPAMATAYKKIQYFPPLGTNGTNLVAIVRIHKGAHVDLHLDGSQIRFGK